MYSTREDVENWLKEMEIKNYIINKDLTVDVNSNVSITSKKLKEILVQFGTIKGNFSCGWNELTSLKGCPEVVCGGFTCNSNKLTNLKSCPKTVNGSFYCFNNNLTSLKDCPEVIHGDFNCSDNALTSLEYCPEVIHGSFNCSDNALTSLEYCPEVIPGNFYCSYNELTNFTYFPKEINGDFIYIHKNKIKEKELVNFNCKMKNVNNISNDFNTVGKLEVFLSKVNYYKSKKENELLKKLSTNSSNIKLNKKL